MSTQRHGDVKTDGTGGGGIPRCPSAQELSLYAHGLLSADERARLLHHVERCSSCERYVHDLFAVLANAKRPESCDPGEEFNRSTWRRIRAQRARRKARIALYPTLAAAALALIFILPFGSREQEIGEDELVENLDFFQNMELLENLELVETIDSVMSHEAMGDQG